jgi:hypothetical protein
LELEVVASDSNRIRLERLGARIERETSANHVGPGFDPTGPPFAGWEPVPWPLARHFPEEAVHLDANGRWTCVDLPVDV